MLVRGTQDLTTAQTRDERENEALREECSSYTKARANELLDGNNQLSSLQKDLERCRHDAYLLQVHLENKHTVRNCCQKIPSHILTVADHDLTCCRRVDSLYESETKSYQRSARATCFAPLSLHAINHT